MKILRRVFPAAATAVVLGMTPLLSAPSNAQSLFGKTEIDQSGFVAVASPIGNGARHQLLLIEQKSNTRACWGESGSNPTIIDPLLLTFNFSGICGRATDANGYSIRVNDEDLGLKYSLAIVRQGGDMVLIGRPQSRSNPSLEIGRAFGETTGFAKLVLNPGWRFTRRTFDGKALGHVYLTNDQTLSSLTGQSTAGQTPPPGPTNPTPPTTPTPPPVSQTNFLDISADLYRSDIEAAVGLGFVSGFKDNTFRPSASLTREQLVSIVVEALQRVTDSPEVIGTAQGNPYPDVDRNRWSAAKIAFARDRNIISGYKESNGTFSFRPTNNVTRAELIAITRRAAEYAKTRLGEDAQLQENQPIRQFADMGGHWSEQVVTQLSAYCGVASPLNETGNSFFPNEFAKRNYATAATLRMFKCVTKTAS